LNREESTINFPDGHGQTTSMRYLITGATGFVGGHIAEACVRKEQTLTALVRPTSDTRELERLGAILYRGELNDPQIVRQAVAEAEVVVHCAAKVGDWGPVDEYRQVNVESLRVLLDACKGQALSRFIHMSSLGVYEARHHHQTDEDTPLPKRHRDGYSQSKVEAEQLAMHYYKEFGVPVVILRPGFVYGPRDRTVLPRIIDNLRKGTMRYPGARGARALNTIFVENLVDAVFLAVAAEAAVGEVYNLTDGEFVSKRRFIEAVADAMGLPHPTLAPPLWLARIVTWGAESLAKMRGAKEAPAFNFTRLKFMGLNLDFSIEKAKNQLGYSPRVKFEEAIGETMDWYKRHYAE
jgi:nucleoside-diphosphate-sugar epimerase